MHLIALVREPPRRLADCELTHIAKQSIDIALARRQHAGYRAVLAGLGVDVHVLPTLEEHPDSVFVEDVAVVLDEVAIVTRPGAPSRRDEIRGLDARLAVWRPVESIAAPGTLDGGDVLRAGRRIWVGRSSRTDMDGIAALRDIAGRHGPYEITAVDIGKSLHLKTAACAIGPDTILLNRGWVDPRAFDGLKILDVPESEPFGANVLLIGDTAILPSEHPRTAELLVSQGVSVAFVPFSEFLKAEAGVTCASIVFGGNANVPA